jgi:group I intron endonuclease
MFNYTHLINLAKRFMRYFNPSPARALRARWVWPLSALRAQGASYLKNRETLVISRALIKYGYFNFSPFRPGLAPVLGRRVEILEYCDIINLTEREQYYLDKLNPRYNTLKIAGSSLGHKLTEETKTKISQSLKGIYVQEKSALYGRTHSEETKALMALKKSKENNPLFGKNHTEETKDLMRQKAALSFREEGLKNKFFIFSALGRKHSEETLFKMSASRGYLVDIHEKCDSEGFKLIGSFVSIRRAAKFLGISSNTIRIYIYSGEVFKDRYKFTGGSPK